MMPVKKTILLIIGFLPTTLHASPESWLLRAATLCPEESNPMTAIKTMQADLFDDIRVTGNAFPVTVYASLVKSPHSRNRAIMAPDQRVGEVRVTFSYENHEVNQLLVCYMEILIPPAERL